MLAFLYCFNFKNYMDIFISHLNLNFKTSWQMQICMEIDSTGNSNSFSIKSCIKMPTLPILCIMGNSINETKLTWILPYSSFQGSLP